jgi:hypothetical protein
MALKDRFRRALTRSSTTTRSNSSASSNFTPPSTSPTETASPITLTKTSTRLSKKLTWRSDKSGAAEKKRQKREEDWEDWDRKTPIPDRKKGPHQDILRAFEFKWRSSMDGGRRSGSIWSGSGVSPGCSRMGSVDDGEAPGVGGMGSVGRKSLGRRRSSTNSAHGGQGGRSAGEGGVEAVIEE